jgi:lactoylglutathione lyase
MKKLDYAIVMVSDMKKAVAFYRDTLGFPLKFESPHWTEFANDGSTIALHPAGEKPAGTCGLGFVVDDLDAFHNEMQAKQVKCLQPPTVEDFGGKPALYADPDGLPFSVGEAPKK